LVVVWPRQEDGDSAADCDIYVRAGSVPTQTTYDFADVSYSPQMTITIPEPQFNTWYAPHTHDTHHTHTHARTHARTHTHTHTTD
jgi:hypothetical protein